MKSSNKQRTANGKKSQKQNEQWKATKSIFIFLSYFHSFGSALDLWKVADMKWKTIKTKKLRRAMKSKNRHRSWKNQNEQQKGESSNGNQAIESVLSQKPKQAMPLVAFFIFLLLILVFVDAPFGVLLLRKSKTSNKRLKGPNGNQVLRRKYLTKHSRLPFKCLQSFLFERKGG